MLIDEQILVATDDHFPDPTLPETNMTSHLKNGSWLEDFLVSFLRFRPIFRCYICCFRFGLLVNIAPPFAKIRGTVPAPNGSAKGYQLHRKNGKFRWLHWKAWGLRDVCCGHRDGWAFKADLRWYKEIGKIDIVWLIWFDFYYGCDCHVLIWRT